MLLCQKKFLTIFLTISDSFWGFLTNCEKFSDKPETLRMHDVMGFVRNLSEIVRKFAPVCQKLSEIVSVFSAILSEICQEFTKNFVRGYVVFSIVEFPRLNVLVECLFFF